MHAQEKRRRLAPVVLIPLLLQPKPAPPPPVVQQVVKKRKRTSGGAFPEANLLDDPLEQSDYFEGRDAEGAEAEAALELAEIKTWAHLLAAILADKVGVEVAALDTQIMVGSAASTVATAATVESGVRADGQLETASAAPSPGVDVDVSVEVFDVVVDPEPESDRDD